MSGRKVSEKSVSIPEVKKLHIIMSIDLPNSMTKLHKKL